MIQAASGCEQAGITADELDAVAFYDKPWLKFERLLETYLSFAPAGLPFRRWDSDLEVPEAL